MDDNSSIEPLSPGTHLHEFVIRESLGRGGSGVVYAADHEILRETFAIKEFLPHHLACRVGGNRVAALPGKEVMYDKLRQKFLEEGQTLIQLARPRPHPNLVQVTDAFRENETVYLCMRLEKGMPLDDIIELRGTIGEHDLMAWVLPLLDGLAHAHACHVWHRDIKPSNIFIREDGTPVLIDFGAAHHERADSAVSVIAQYTPNFAAPEQMFGGVQGPWTDIYALAATCFSAMTGHSPPPRLSPDWQVQYPGYSAPFLQAVEAGLQFDPERRPQNVAQWRKLFEAASVAEVETVVTSIDDVETIVVRIDGAATEVCDAVPNVLPGDALRQPTGAVAFGAGEPPIPQPQSRRWLYPLGGLAVLVLSLLIGFQARDWIGSNRPERPPSIVPDAPREAMPRAEENQPSFSSPATVGSVDALQLRSELKLDELDCARVELSPLPNMGVRLSGYLRDREQLAGVIERLRILAPRVEVDDREIAFAAPFCNILSRMKTVGRDGGDSVEAERLDMPVVLLNHRDRMYREEEYLSLTVSNEGSRGGYLYLDFVDSNQEAVHLFPTADMPDHYLAPGTRIVIGARDTTQCERQPDACFVVSRPHGNNLIMATWSEEPLFSRWRIPQAEPATEYLDALTAAITERSSDNLSRPRVDYRFFTTLD